MQEIAVIKVAGGVGGAVGTLAAIVAKKDVSRIEAWSIVTVGVFLSIIVPQFAARYFILKYNMLNDFETLLGMAGCIGLISGLIGFKVISIIYKMTTLVENNPVPFLRKLLGLFGGDK